MDIKNILASESNVTYLVVTINTKETEETLFILNNISMY